MTHTKNVRRITSHSLTFVEDGLTVSDKLVLLPLDSSLTQRQKVRHLTSPRFTLLLVLLMSDNLVLLAWEKYHTNCYTVRHIGKTTHPAYQETNAVDRPGQTYKIGYPSLQL